MTVGDIRSMTSNDEDISARDLDAVIQLVGAEGMAADRRDWEQWLQFFGEDCVYWVPTWRGEGTLTKDPCKELSHIYYTDKTALRDRILRLKSPASPASSPSPRTTHMYSSFALREGSTHDLIKVRCAWSTYIYEPFAKSSHVIFGFQEYDISNDNNSLEIVRKKVILQNDYITTMLDVQMF